MPDTPKEQRALTNLEKSGMHFTQEQWDAKSRDLKEDAKKPLSQRRYLPMGLGTVAMDEHFFEEDLENALIYSNPHRFIQLRARICRIAVKEIEDYDPVIYLQEAILRVETYVEGHKTKDGLQRILYSQTRAAIVKGINQLIQEYQQPAPPTSAPFANSNSELPMITETEKQITSWENRLQDFIYIATRYPINAVYEEVRPGLMFSAYFQDHVTEARTLYEQFKQALRQEIINSKVNPDFYKKDISKKFLPKIKYYEEWYQQHKKETEIFGDYNPYALMWNVIESTRDEIFKYFPELETTAPATSAPAGNDKPKRINTDAQDKRNRLLTKYDGYRRNRYTKANAITALVHDFRLEYNPQNPANRKKTIQAIIRKHRKNEE